MKKRPVIALLTLCLMATLFFGVQIDECSAIVLDLPIANSSYLFSGGDGSKDDPYSIDSPQDFAQFGANVNGGSTYVGKYFELASDIDLGVYEKWVPIGINGFSPDQRFQGTLDGKGHEISNFTVEYQSSYSGLFGILQGGTLCNLVLSNGRVNGKDMVGLAVGLNYGTVYNISVVDSDVTGHRRVGGVVGHNGVQVYNCSTDAYTIVSGVELVGGIAGYNYFGSLFNCYNMAFVAKNTENSYYTMQNHGGIVGKNQYGELGNVFNAGMIENMNGFGQVMGEGSMNYYADSCYYNTLWTPNNMLGTAVSDNCFYNYTSTDEPLSELLNKNLDKSYLSDTRYLTWTQEEGDIPRLSTEYWVAPIKVESLEVTSKNDKDTLAYGDTLQMVAIASPEDARDKSVSWSVENGTGKAKINASGLLTSESIGKVTVIAVANDGNGVQNSLEITITKGEQNAPENLLGLAPRFIGYSDGIITGTNEKMEFSIDQSDWVACSGADITGLSKGNYYVRYKETEYYNSGEIATVMVPASNISAPVATVEGTLGENDWYIGQVNLVAPTGYTVSTDGQNFFDKIQFTDDCSWKSFEYYLKEISSNTVEDKIFTNAIKIDQTRPTILETIVKEITSQSASITITPYDKTSGIEKICISNVNSTPEHIIENGTEIDKTFELSGLAAKSQYYVYVAAVDFAGNVTTYTDTIQFTTLPATPSAPTLESQTATSIVLNAVNGCEYKRDNLSWQDSPYFSDLSPNTNYTFYQRIKKKEPIASSESSTGTTISTEKGTLIVEIPPRANAVYGTKLESIPIIGGMVKFGEEPITGTWAWSEAQDPNVLPPVDGDSKYEIIFIPNRNAEDYKPLSTTILPVISKDNYLDDYEIETEKIYDGESVEILTESNISSEYSYMCEGETEFLPGKPMNAGTYTVKIIIQGDQNHNDFEKIVTGINIFKANLTGTPTFQEKADRFEKIKVDLSGVQFNDVMVPGTISWKDSNGTPLMSYVKAEKGETYYWTFSSDSNNFNKLEGKVVFTKSATRASSDNSTNEYVAIYVDDDKEFAGSLRTETSNAQSTTMLTVSDEKLCEILKSRAQGAEVVIPIKTGSSICASLINGQTIKDLESKESTIEMLTKNTSYRLPAKLIAIDDIANRFGEGVALKDITVEIRISEASDEMVDMLEEAAQKNKFSIVSPAEDFTIRCTYNGKEILVNSFGSYVTRRIAISVALDQTSILTGIAINSDGSTRHVPTRMLVIDGDYFAEISSLTNSTYAVIDNEIIFTDIENHWAQNSIHEMGARMVVSGIGNNEYAPNSQVNRAEFATILVKALGLEAGNGSENFTDVSETDWYASYITTAVQYGLIAGYSDGTFRPEEEITREQVMAIVARTMKLTGMEASLRDDEVAGLFAEYEDAELVANYARNSVATCLKTGLISGRTDVTLAPQKGMSRAEIAVVIERLLQKSALI
ncbi:S-layer homology domain-containing protein [Clostridia bacterium]|nr:S-layer homology domain-containing protein [Clostridia bacterium]